MKANQLRAKNNRANSSLKWLKRLIIGAFLLPSSLAFSQDYPASDTTDYMLDKQQLFIVQGMLEQMGLTLPDKKIKPDPKPEPTPVPDKKQSDQQQNKKKEQESEQEKDFFAEGDDFFAQSDDFFSSDDSFANADSFEASKKAMLDDFEKTKKQWQKEYQATLKQWEKARKDFLNRLDEFKQATVEPKQLNQVKANIVGSVASRAKPISRDNQINLRTMQAGDFYIVDSALDLAIKDQGRRATCAAFTAVRAMEIVLKQNQIKQDLSEQHFYAMSKPDCTPCNQAGSHYAYGLYGSQNGTPLLTESACRYNPKPIKGNETHHPLNRCSDSGARYSASQWQIYEGKRAHNWVVDELLNNRPVMAGFKLTPNFYDSKGYITQKQARRSGKMDKHADGHAVLLVGLIKLDNQHEGRYCAIAANSWTKGWGRGGYACLSEKWMKQNSLNMYISLNQVSRD